MMEKNTNLEDVVSLISKKVAERLNGQIGQEQIPSAAHKNEGSMPRKVQRIIIKN